MGFLSNGRESLQHGLSTTSPREWPRCTQQPSAKVSKPLDHSGQVVSPQPPLAHVRQTTLAQADEGGSTQTEIAAKVWATEPDVSNGVTALLCSHTPMPPRCRTVGSSSQVEGAHRI